MCGRFTLRTPLSVLVTQFKIESYPLWNERYNIAPTQDVLAIRYPREVIALHWGLIPSWSKDARQAAINARSDSVATKPYFRAAWRRRRCLVLADGYYEWLRKGKVKQPYLYEVDAGKPFALAGLWESWSGPSGSAGPPLQSCAIITTEGNELTQAVHDRMPVILDADDYDAWLDPDTPSAELESLLDSFPADRMSVRPASTFVNDARHEGPQCVESPPGEL
jgi:putative SOS response-associated peptidase YedK